MFLQVLFPKINIGRGMVQSYQPYLSPVIGRESRRLNDATLIWDNRILAVPYALISMPGRQMKKDNEEIVVSTFGILIGSEIYRWGLDGVHGVRLHTAQIDKERMRVELLHQKPMLIER
ncbi:MAG: hypothetical protein ACOX3R_12840 [Desulfitobacteriia bacterium]